MAAKLELKKVIPILQYLAKGIEPIVERNENGVYTCKLCNTVVAREDTEEHVRKYHKDQLSLTVKKMMERLEEYKSNKEKAIVVPAS